MAMQKRTVEKIAKFREDYRGRELNHFQYINTERYPSWTTLKRYSVIQKVETIEWYHGEGELELVNIYKVVE